MMKPSCDQRHHDMLCRALDDRLTEQQEEELSRHLAECASCRQDLEELAAKREEWLGIQTALRRQMAAEAQQAGEENLVATEAHAESALDFAVNFLQPATQPGAMGRLGDIEIDSVIGHGGMGIVLKGFQQELNRPVAVKVLAPHLAISGAARKRFTREAQAAAAIMHPNVMPILAVNSSARLPYLVMPYVTCESLQQRLDREGPLPVIDVLRIGLHVSRGLAAAHAQGLIHRDVKPANILLEMGVDRAMLTDFGLARAADDASLTRSGVVAGTPQYMSPEQARGEPIDVRSDLFSVGSVMYAMCTARPPFRAETSYGILRRVTDDVPRPIREISPAVPDWLERIVHRLHCKDAADRYGSAEAVAALLEKCLAHAEQPTAIPLPHEIRTPSRRGRRSLVGVIASFAAAGLIGGWMMSGTIVQQRMAPPVPPHSETAASRTSDTVSNLPAQPPSQAAAHWDDGIDVELSDIARELDRLQQEINKP